MNNTARPAIKIGIVAAITLLLLIPLLMVENIIEEREGRKCEVKEEIASSYAKAQTIGGPVLRATVVTRPATDSTAVETEEYVLRPSVLNYLATVNTDVRSRSIYDVIVFNSMIEMTGTLPVSAEVLNAVDNVLNFDMTDFKGLSDLPSVTLGGETFKFERVDDELHAHIQLPENVKAGESVEFSMTLNVKGSESLMFYPVGEQTTLAMTSAYPHPSFQGDFLPESREVRNDGFDAGWSVLRINTNCDYDKMGVKFVEPANSYQQALRSAKYGMLIIVLAFIAGLFVEYLTHKEINPVQYGVIGLSLVLFYALLLSFSEFITFGVAYLIAVTMTVVALTCYYRAILKSKSAYLLGVFLLGMYCVNYILLQMETYVLLAGTLVLFVLLSVTMYLTTDVNRRKYLNINNYEKSNI